jgi:ubiquitin-conjugating enzyme E2 O
VGKSGDEDDCFNMGTTVYKNIMREWKILDKDLPDTIYVRVYDTRVDLLRAVLVGATGTPYRDGLFFFDIKFPPDYPRHPPKVHYRSHGLLINPNMGYTGHICLSLLNTWIGWGYQRWNPAQSTILQVLVSLQALVLNEEPYYNQPLTFIGLETLNSKFYNQNVFILTCKSHLYLLRNPPKNFEDFTAEHFRRRAGDIMRACCAYASGRVEVGYYINEIDSAVTCPLSNYDSNKFKRSMEQLYPLLGEAFTRNGVEEDDLMVVETSLTTTPFADQPEKKTELPHSRRFSWLFCLLPCLPWAANFDEPSEINKAEPN